MYVSLGEVAVGLVVVKIVVFLPDYSPPSLLLCSAGTTISSPLITSFVATVIVDCGTVPCCVDNTTPKVIHTILFVC
jgi:hypothetical protein